VRIAQMSIWTRSNLSFVSVSAANTAPAICHRQTGHPALPGNPLRAAKQHECPAHRTFLAPRTGEQRACGLTYKAHLNKTSDRIATRSYRARQSVGVRPRLTRHSYPTLARLALCDIGRAATGGAGQQVVLHQCSRTCVDRVGSPRASRCRHAIPGLFRLSRTTAPAGCMVRGGASRVSEVRERLRCTFWKRY
jgi:hypothetical protein